MPLQSLILINLLIFFPSLFNLLFILPFNITRCNKPILLDLLNQRRSNHLINFSRAALRCLCLFTWILLSRCKLIIVKASLEIEVIAKINRSLYHSSLTANCSPVFLVAECILQGLIQESGWFTHRNYGLCT